MPWVSLVKAVHSQDALSVGGNELSAVQVYPQGAALQLGWGAAGSLGPSLGEACRWSPEAEGVIQSLPAWLQPSQPLWRSDSATPSAL